MDNLELIIRPIRTSQITEFFKLTRFADSTILDAHFFDNGVDIDDISKIDFSTYYRQPATGFIKVNQLFIGVDVTDVVLVLSGVDDDLEVTINFPYVKVYEEKATDIQRWCQTHFPNTSKRFGFEPVDDDDLIFSC